MVLVYRSGMEARRLSPSVLSLRKPEMILRDEKSESQRASVSSIPPQSRAFISARSSVHMAGVKTDETGTSRV